MAISPAYKSITGNIACDWKLAIVCWKSSVWEGKSARSA
jgi:hypothetical protein